jgi:hypothetical protein
MTNPITLEKLVGTWKLVKADVEIEDGVEMNINADGSIDYIVHHGGQQERIDPAFQLEKNLTISDQPSYPQERTTKMTFDHGYLLFDYADSKVWFEKVV